jgi:uncharacterized protein (TIGR03083 family)
MQHDEYCEAIRREGAALAAGARTAGLDARVPSCPEWDVAELLSHIGRIHRWVTAIVEEGGDSAATGGERSAEPTQRKKRGSFEDHWSQAEPPPRAGRVDWFAAGVDPLAEALLQAGPAVEVWTWTDDHSTGFWARRQANETAVHRWDAQLAAGAPQPLTRDLAADGLDEYLSLLTHWRGLDALGDLTGTIHFHCTDGEGEWLVRLGDGVHVTREHAKGDVAARGSASDLMLVMSGRLPASTVEVFGDAELLDTFLARARW